MAGTSRGSIPLSPPTARLPPLLMSSNLQAAEALTWPGGCTPGSHLCPDNGVIPAEGGRELVVATILRMLLRIITGGMLAGGVVLLLVRLGLGTGAPDLPYWGIMAALAAVTGLLFWPRNFSLRQMRGLELAVLALMAAYLAFSGYSGILAELRAGEAGLALSAWHRTILHFALLAVAYALLIPGGWLRTTAVAVPVAAAPLLVGGLLWVNHPELTDITGRAATAVRLFDGVFVATIAAGLAVMASQVVSRFFDAAYDANESQHYRLQERIGIGGMGEVWLAEHKTLARPAAIKLIRREMVADGNRDQAERMLRRFEREARATAGLRSPHTVEIYDFGVTNDGTFYYAMEFLEGVDLESLVKKHGPVPVARTVHILRQACDSLGDAHDRGFTHRDIKPANIFLCRMGVSYDWVKVLDFGLVKRDPQEGEVDEASLTVEGTTSGTPAYMAPEMALNKPGVDGRADIYALGCVGYWLVTGKHVFDGDNNLGVIVEHVKTEPMPPSRRTEMTIPEELDRILLKCLAKEPADRFQSTEELATALDEVPGDPWSQRQAEEWWKLHRPADPGRVAA